MFCVTLIAVASLACVQGLYGGSPSSIWDYPYQAAILRRHWDSSQFRYACSGAIVSQTFILTTASCSKDSYENFRVRVGSSYHQSGGDLHRVRDVYRHPNFTADLDSDLALLQLADSLQLSARVAAVTLPRQDEVLRDIEQTTISSWEFDSEAVMNSIKSHQRLEIVSECNSIYGKHSRGKELVTYNMICIRYAYTAHSYPYISPCCEREQGALLVVNGTLYGLSSWSYQCGSTTYPSVFTKVSAFTTWIGFMLEL